MVGPRACNVVVLAVGVVLAAGCSLVSPRALASGEPERPGRWTDPPVGQTVDLSESEWRQRLTAEEFRVLRRRGTERAFTGRFHDHHEPGTYRCAGCGQPLFSSAHKFDSGTGWPSFDRPISGRVASETDDSYGMARTEVHCARCGGHLGHVFDDGPTATRNRYCINSIALDFERSRRTTRTDPG